MRAAREDPIAGGGRVPDHPWSGPQRSRAVRRVEVIGCGGHGKIALLDVMAEGSGQPLDRDVLRKPEPGGERAHPRTRPLDRFTPRRRRWRRAQAVGIEAHAITVVPRAARATVRARQKP